MAIIERDLAERLEGEAFDTYMQPLTAFTGGFHNDVIDTIAARPTGTVADYEGTLALLESVAAYVDQWIALLSEGLAGGYSQSQRTVRLVAEQLLAQSTPSADTTRVLAAFRAFPRSMPSADQQR